VAPERGPLSREPAHYGPTYKGRGGHRRDETPRLLVATTEAPLDVPTEAVHCPDCLRPNEVALDASSFRCTGCEIHWVWVICSNCNDFTLQKGAESFWGCQMCGTTQRGWWRGGDVQTELYMVVAQRAKGRLAFTLAEERQRRTKWLAIGGAGLLVVVALFGASRLLASAAPSPDQQSKIACTRYSQLQNADTGGATPVEFQDGLKTVAAAGKGATAEVKRAADALGKVDTSNNDSFAVAASAMTAACTRFAR
jgi:ribosomal protein L37AE/L43A